MAGSLTLGVNGWRLQWSLAGVARYLMNVVHYWTPEVVAGRFDEINFYTPSQLAPDRAAALPAGVQERVLGPRWRLLVWENLRFGPFVRDDVLFCPSYSRPLRAHGKTVVVTFEATMRLFPELYPRKARLLHSRLYGWSARNATLVITPTDAASRDVANAYGVSPEKIRMVPLAPAAIFMRLQGDTWLHEVKERYVGADAPFFLHVGKFTARRNVPMLMEAFAELKRRTGLPHKLIVVGMNETDLDVASLASTLGIVEDFRHYERVSDDDLNKLYNAAESFVLPYTYEALSLTAQEAQATGTPVLTVDAPGLREVTGDAALFISRAETRELSEAMERLARDEALRRELSERGRANAARYSWERCSIETLAVLEEAARFPAETATA